MARKKSKRTSSSRLSFNPDKAKKFMEKGQQFGGSSYVNLPNGIEWFKPQYNEGKSTAIYYLNIVPFIAGKHNKEAEEGNIWFRSKFRRAKVGSEGTLIVSPSTFGKPCPVSAMYAKYKDDANISDKELDTLKVKDRELYYVVDCREKTKSGKPQVRLMDFSYYLFGEKLDTELYSEEYEEEGYDAMMFADIYEGRTLKITFKQKTYGSAKYSEADKITLIERKPPKITEKMVTSLKDPLSLLELLPTSKIKNMMADDDGMDMDDVEEGGSELEEMTRSELKAYIRENELDIKPKKSMSDDDIRDAIMEALEDDEEDDEVVEGDDDAFDGDDIPYEFDDDEESEEDDDEDESEDEEDYEDEEDDW